jgi:hypothetical protein
MAQYATSFFVPFLIILGVLIPSRWYWVAVSFGAFVFYGEWYSLAISLWLGWLAARNMGEEV